MMIGRRIYILPAGLLLILLFAAGCKQQETILQSTWGQSDFSNYQSLLDRNRPLTYLEDQRINIGLQNDAENLYLILRSSDKNIRNQVKYGGLIVWFDATGNQNKSVGIEYPLRSMLPPPPPAAKREKKDDKAHPDSSKISNLPGEEKEPLVNLNILDVLGPNKTVLKKLTVNDFPNLTASLKDTLGTMIYELKVPLKKSGDSSFAIGTDPGNTIGIGLESGGFHRDFAPKDTAENMEPPNEPGQYGGMNGPFSDLPTHPKRRMGMMAEPIEFWAKVVLASPNDK